MSKLLISVSVSESSLEKKKAELTAKIEKQQASLQDLQTQLREVTRELRTINGARTRSSTVQKTGGKEMLSVDGQTFKLSAAKEAMALGRKTHKSMYYIGKDGSRTKIMMHVAGRGGAKNHRPGYGFHTKAAAEKFKGIIRAPKVGFLKTFE